MVNDRPYLLPCPASCQLASLADTWEVCPAFGARPSFDYPLPLGRAAYGPLEGVGHAVTNRKGFPNSQSPMGATVSNLDPDLGSALVGLHQGPPHACGPSGSAWPSSNSASAGPPTSGPRSDGGNQVPDFIPRYSAKELGDYCGLPEKRAKAALAELQSLGLLTEFTESRIAFRVVARIPRSTPRAACRIPGLARGC